MFRTAHMGGFTLGEDCISTLRSHWLPVALHIGMEPYEMSLCTLICQLVVSACRSCLGKHVIEILWWQLFCDDIMNLPSRSLIDKLPKTGCRIPKHYKIAVYSEVFLERTKACHCPLLEESIQTCLSITRSGKCPGGNLPALKAWELVYLLPKL